MRAWIPLPLTLAALAASACDWVATASHALSYPTVRRGEAANLVAGDSLAYVTLGEAGLAVLDGRTREQIAVVQPAAGSESSDALARDGELLFVLDARKPGHLSVYSLEDARSPRLVSAPREVPVGPFSGVSAHGGHAIVSGGTSELTAWRYDSTGKLGDAPFAKLDLGRGQPNVLVARSGRRAYVATHYKGPRFGLELIGLERNGALERLGSLELPGAGFTSGGAKPANFPIVPLELSDDTLLIASGRGLDVVEVSNPAVPRLLATLELGAPAVSAAVEGRQVAVTLGGGSPGVAYLDFSGRESRVTQWTAFGPGTHPLGVALTRTGALVAARGKGVLKPE